MRFSNLFCPTLKESPREAEVQSHILMLRAGMIQKVAGGIFSYLPLGKRIIQKCEAIVREEMNKSGAQEIFMPSVIPAELWVKSGRWQKYGKELLRLKDRHDQDYCIGPTHEEVVTDMISRGIKSYKQLPLNVYQIQTKFRDEIRPRFGLMRGREFTMKDAYSFHENTASLDDTYDVMKQTYESIFERCGLNFKVVAADSGNIGGDSSAEFMVTAQTGEDAIMECSSCNYAANLEAAEVVVSDIKDLSHLTEQKQKIHTPNVQTISDLCDFLKIEATETVKSLVYQVDKEIVLIIIRGDYDANDAKLAKLFKTSDYTAASPEVLRQHGLIKGSIGPINAHKDIRIIADYSLRDMDYMVVGGNEADTHITHVCLNRDFKVDGWADVRSAVEGEPCPKCNAGNYSVVRGIEVGHIFKLGTVYSESMGAVFLDQDGKSKPMIMGCYGIGVTRTVAAAIEQNFDDKGICWPIPLAPYTVNVIIANIKDEVLVEAGESLYDMLKKEDIDTILDDRKEMIGFKFKDSELIGFPFVVVVGKKWKENQTLEVKVRQSGEEYTVNTSELVALLREKGV